MLNGLRMERKSVQVDQGPTYYQPGFAVGGAQWIRGSDTCKSVCVCVCVCRGGTTAERSWEPFSPFPSHPFSLPFTFPFTLHTAGRLPFRVPRGTDYSKSNGRFASERVGQWLSAEARWLWDDDGPVARCWEVMVTALMGSWELAGRGPGLARAGQPCGTESRKQLNLPYLRIFRAFTVQYLRNNTSTSHCQVFVLSHPLTRPGIYCTVEHGPGYSTRFLACAMTAHAAPPRARSDSHYRFRCHPHRAPTPIQGIKAAVLPTAAKAQAHRCP